MIFSCAPGSVTLNKHKKIYQHNMLSTVCVLNPILWFISLCNCPATVSHAERQNYQKKFCFLCVACLFLRIKSVWNFFSSRVRAKIFCVSPERSQAWAGHAQNISRIERWGRVPYFRAAFPESECCGRLDSRCSKKICRRALVPCPGQEPRHQKKQAGTKIRYGRKA